MKTYPCEICSTEVVIRSTVKSGPNQGKKVCSGCAAKNRQKKTSKQTQATRAKRKETRREYPEFFKTQIQKYAGTSCQECGCKLEGSVVEIAHILAKSTSQEVAVEPRNILGLCAYCHARFDSSLDARSKMHCFPESVERYLALKDRLENTTAETLFYDNIANRDMR